MAASKYNPDSTLCVAWRGDAEKTLSELYADQCPVGVARQPSRLVGIGIRVFRTQLPLAYCDNYLAKASKTCGRIRTYKVLMPKKRSVVAVIDDNVGIRGAMARLLSALGYETELYASADEFLDVAIMTEAICLIIDVQKPFSADALIAALTKLPDRTPWNSVWLRIAGCQTSSPSMPDAIKFLPRKIGAI